MAEGAVLLNCGLDQFAAVFVEHVWFVGHGCSRFGFAVLVRFESSGVPGVGFAIDGSGFCAGKVAPVAGERDEVRHAFSVVVLSGGCTSLAVGAPLFVFRLRFCGWLRLGVRSTLRYYFGAARMAQS